MKTLGYQLKRFARDERGAAAIEYGMILALMVIAIIAAIGATGENDQINWDKVNNAYPES